MTTPYERIDLRKIDNSALVQVLQSTAEALKDSQYLSKLLEVRECQTEEVFALIAHLRHVAINLLTQAQPYKQYLVHANLEPLINNLYDVLERMQHAVFAGSRPKLAEAETLCEFQLIPIWRVTQESFYYWCHVNQSKKLRAIYLAQEFGPHLQNKYVAKDKDLFYQATVIVVGYNKLESSRRCVESILHNTNFSQLKTKLILVDHGSTDGTLEYFKSVRQATVLHFKHNMSITMFLMMPMICHSQYYVHVANDTVVTKDWLEILLACIKSDPRIVLASPATPNITNEQDRKIPTSNCAELIAIAEQHNRPNPSLWMERTQVYPPLGIFDISILNQIGFWDPFFYSFHCSDDDFSTRARRAGFRQILCEDVFCFHEKKDDTAKENSIQGSIVDAQLFSNRYGFKPLSNGCCFDKAMLDMLYPLPTTQTAHILAINCGVGDSPLQIRNTLRNAGLQSDIYYVCSEAIFVDDIKHISHQLVQTTPRQLLQAIQESFPDVEFAYICFDKELPASKINLELIDTLASRMSAHTKLLFTVQNPLFIENVISAQELKLKGLFPFNWPKLDKKLFIHFSTYNYKASGKMGFSENYLRIHTESVISNLDANMLNLLRIRRYTVWAQK